MDASTEILNEDDYIKILQSRFQVDKITFVKAEMTPFFKNMEGFLGEHYLLKLEYKMEDTIQTEEFFVKTKPKSPLHRQLVDAFNAFEKEIFFYNSMTKVFDEMEYDISFAPKCYYCKNNEIIVLENLKEKDFKLFPRGDFYDMKHCKLSLDALAQLHANFMAYEEKKSLELGKPYHLNEEKPELFKEFFYSKDGIAAAGNFIASTVKFFSMISKLVPKSEEWRATFEKNLQACDFAKIFWTSLPFRKACTHGDLWSNNILFKYTNEVPTQCCLLDYQLLRYHHLSFDPLLILYANTGREFRKKHLDELLNYHYDTFAKNLENFGFEAERLLPKEDYMKSAKVLAVVALFQYAGGRTMTLLPKEIVDNAMANMAEGMDEAKMTEMGHEICKTYFKNNERYRSILTDDVYDLYEHLLDLQKDDN